MFATIVLKNGRAFKAFIETLGTVNIYYSLQSDIHGLNYNVLWNDVLQVMPS